MKFLRRAQIVEILADGLRRDLELSSQRLDVNPTVTPGDIENVLLARQQWLHERLPMRFSYICNFFRNYQ